MVALGRSFSGHERNCCFLNTLSDRRAGGRFADISASSGLDFPEDGRAVALVDWDQDGQVDMWIANRSAPRLRLMRNQASPSNHFATIRLIGNGTTTNRDAIGARAEVITGGASQWKRVKTLRAGEGFLAQGSKWLHFGLGSANRIDRVEVRWPDGQLEQFHDLEVDGRYQLEQGKGTARRVDLAGRKTKLKPSLQQVLPSSDRARIPLLSLASLPGCSYIDESGNDVPLVTKMGKPLLVNLWASWCGPCADELNELAKRQEQIRAKGIQIVALSVDGMGDSATDEAAAARVMEQIKFPFTAGMATPQLVETFQFIHDGHINLQRRLPLPTSFLIDEKGRVAVIYKGRLEVDDLLEDVVHAHGSQLDRFARAAAVVGRPLAHSHLEQTAITGEARIPFRFAVAESEIGLLDDACTHYREVLQLKPDSVFVQTNLGKLYWKSEKSKKALTHLNHALRIDPTFAEAHYNLGVVYEAQKKLALAKGLYDKAIQLNPEYAEAHNNLGSVLLQQGQQTEALEYFQLAVQADPNNAAAHYNLGIIYDAQQNPVQAAASYQRALEINPDNALAHYRLANVYEKQDRIPQAIASYRQVIVIDPDHAEAHYNLGVLYDARDDLNAARAVYERAVRINPAYAKARNNLAIVLARQGEVQRAREEFELAIRSDAEYAEAHFNLGNLLMQQGELSSAKSSFERALRITPENPQVHFSLAGVALGLSDHQAAIEHYRTTLQIKRDFLTAANNLAWLLATDKQATARSAAEAVKWAKHAADTTGHNEPGFLDTLAVAYAATGEFDKAIETANKAKRLFGERGQDKAILDIQGRLGLYKAKQPYRAE